MYSISSKLHSTVSTIGKATANKIIAKVVGTHLFAFMLIINVIRTCGQAAKHSCEIWDIFVLSNIKVFCLIWKLIVIELPVTFL